MAAHSQRSRALRIAVGRHGSTVACGLFVAAAVTGAALTHSLSLAIYALGFWHYYLYWLAFAFGPPAFDVFKRDAVAAKTVSVGTLAAVYLVQPLDVVSLAAIAGGVLLNLRAAAVLGIDRTYYGHEVAGLPHRRLTDFPYSLTDHPMILGNVAAFGGTLLNPDFARSWWPLAALHVGMNIGLLAMELAGRRRAIRIGGGLVFTLVLAGATVAALHSGQTSPLSAGLLAAAALACASVLHRGYAPTTEGRSS